MEICGDRFPPGDPFVDRSEGREPSTRAVGFAHGDRAVESDDGRVGQAEQLVVPLHDLDPVGLLHAPRVSVERGDRGLCLVLAQPVARQRSLHDLDTLGDQVGVPLASILLGERHDPAIWSPCGSGAERGGAA